MFKALLLTALIIGVGLYVFLGFAGVPTDTGSQPHQSQCVRYTLGGICAEYSEVPMQTANALPIALLSAAQVVTFILKAFYKGNDKHRGAANECLRDYAGDVMHSKPYEHYTLEQLADICAWIVKYSSSIGVNHE